MAKSCAADGVNCHYREDDTHATGTCAVLVHGGERSLVANLSAATCYASEHLIQPHNWFVVEKARFFYIAGFFLTVSPESVLLVAKHAQKNHKCFMMNLAAPFICEFFAKPLLEALYYVDYIFGNEVEAQTFGKVQGWTNLDDVGQIAINISKLPLAAGKERRVAVITQGPNPCCVAFNGQVTKYPVTPIAKNLIVDTNGAGDSFVGGYLSQLVQGRDVAECIRAANYAANVVIQHPNCTYPPKPNFSPPARTFDWF
jgi:adenosine kinase